MEDIGDEQIVVSDLERAEPLDEWLAADNELVIETDGERDSDDDTDVNDDSAHVVEVTFESVGVLNRVYQDSLDGLADYVKAKLRENVSRQTELSDAEDSEHVRQLAIGAQYSHPNSLLPFMAPYFQDEKGGTPDDNEDTLEKRRKGELNEAYLCANKPWSAAERKRLTEQMQMQAMEDMQKPYRNEKESLTAKKCVLSVQINGRIDELSGRIDAIGGRPLAEFALAERNDPAVDWSKIHSALDAPHNQLDCQVYWNNYLHPDVNKSAWSKDEDKRLVELVVKYDRKEWDRIAAELGSGRVGWQCCARYQSELNREMRRVGPLTKAEAETVEKVIASVRVGDYIPWHQVSYLVQGRTLNQIKHYWNKVNVPKRGEGWTEEENRVLSVAVKRYGVKNWRKVAYFLPGRSNRQCRERYMMRLGVADRKLGNWTPREDELILKLAPKFEFSWIKLEKHIKGRNARQIASRYEMLNKWRQSDGAEGVDSKGAKKASNKDGKRKTRTITVKSKLSDRIRSAISRNRKPLESLDDILRAGRARLARQLELDKSVSAPTPTRARPKKELTEEEIDERITKMFALYESTKASPKKGNVLSSKEQKLYEATKSAVNELLTGEQSTAKRGSKLVDAIKEVITTTVTKTSGERLGSQSGDLAPIFPPNRANVNGYRSLLMQTNRLTQTVAKGKINLKKASANLVNSREYSQLSSLFKSVFVWPHLLSDTAPKKIEEPVKVESAATPASNSKRGRRACLSSDSTRLIQIREKQSQLIKTALLCKDDDNGGENSSDNEPIDETSTRSPWYLKPRDRKYYSLKSLDKQSFVYTRIKPKREDMPAIEPSVQTRRVGRPKRTVVTGAKESQARETAESATNVQKRSNKKDVKKELISVKDNASLETCDQLVATTSAQTVKRPRGRPPKKNKESKN